MTNEGYTGKVAIVTGASRGIGRAIALGLAAQGYDVAVNYHSSAQAAEQVAQEIQRLGRKALIVQADVSDFDQAKQLVDQTLETFGQVDVLVNNAGITKDGLLARMSQEDFDSVIAANLKSAFNMCRHVMRPMMKKRNGRIINITSVAGVMGNPGQANYSASKAGLIGLTKSIAREVASRGITVNAIAPGLVKTDMTDQMPESARQQMVQMVPIQRMGTAEEIASAVCFFAAETSSYITGQVLCVDGGMAM